MDEREITAALRQLAGAGPTFLLSKVRDSLADKRPLLELADAIRPVLADLDLDIHADADDHMIVRPPPGTPAIPTDRERQRQLAFFRRPEVPAYIQRLIEEYIAKKTRKTWDGPLVLERISSLRCRRNSPTTGRSRTAGPPSTAPAPPSGAPAETRPGAGPSNRKATSGRHA